MERKGIETGLAITYRRKTKRKAAIGTERITRIKQLQKRSIRRNYILKKGRKINRLWKTKRSERKYEKKIVRIRRIIKKRSSYVGGRDKK